MQGGYDTFMAGKWHLGVGKGGEYLPYNRGFQHYYGVPYGVDMCSLSNIGEPCFAPDVQCDVGPFVGGSANFPGRDNEVPCPFYINATIIEQPTSLLTIDEKYVNATRAFIMAHRSPPRQPASAAQASSGTSTSPLQHGGSGDAPNPFFVYFASHHTHVPAFANAAFTNTSGRGWFGDHLRMLDWSVGEIMQALTDAGVADTTLTLFSADNGPSLVWENLGGNNGALRCGKGTTWEGGQRVPGIVHWPGEGIARNLFPFSLRIHFETEYGALYYSVIARRCRSRRHIPRHSVHDGFFCDVACACRSSTAHQPHDRLDRLYAGASGQARNARFICVRE